MRSSLLSSAGFTLEQILLEELQHAYRVIPLANIRPTENRGPRLESEDGDTTLPDAMIFGDRRGAVEIKAKSYTNHYDKWDRDEHGIDKNSFFEYIAFHRKTGMVVYLLIAELESGALLMADLDTLRTQYRPRSGTWKNGTPSMNFDRRAFAQVGVFAIANGDLRKTSVTWDKEALDSFLSQLAFDFAAADFRT